MVAPNAPNRSGQDGWNRRSNFYELPDNLLAADATLFSVVLTAYALALAYFSGTDEVVIGVPVANRDVPEVEDVVTFALNMIPLRLTLDLGAPVRDVVRGMHRRARDGVRDGRVPFAEISRLARRADRSDSAQPVFRAMFNFLAYPFAPVQQDGVTFALSELDTGFTKYDLSLYAQVESDADLLLQIAYQTDGYGRLTAERLLASVRRALAQIAADPDAVAANIALLPPQDVATARSVPRPEEHRP